MSEEDRLFHNPFAGLGKLAKEAKKQAEEQARAKRAAAQARAQRERKRHGDASRFATEMAGVEPLARDNFVPHRKPPAAGVPTPDEQVVAELDALVGGTAAFDVQCSDEHIEGLAMGVDRRLLRELRGGVYSYQAHIDLHGRTRQEAQQLVRQFLHESRKNGLRCVLIVHGRGLNSEDRVPVLKEAVARWLTRGGMGKGVLAFCSARRGDGGLGAVYVLLRKRP